MLSRMMFSLSFHGADDRDRTGDLVLTKDVLCQLSYIGPLTLSGLRQTAQNRLRSCAKQVVERETGIEPATNSLEGCDSTTELLPRPCGKMLVARGGFEPPKPFRRQIYSLLHLTALQPRPALSPLRARSPHFDPIAHVRIQPTTPTRTFVPGILSSMTVGGRMP